MSAAQTVALVPELGEHRAEGDIERTRHEQSRYGTDPVGAVDHEDEHDEHDEDVDDPLPNETPPRDRSSRIPRHAFVLAALTRSIRLVRVGVLTGGGDCPGLNAVIRAIVRKGEPIDQAGLDKWDLEGIEDDSVLIIRDLLPYITGPDFTVKWSWQPGDIVAWDNRTTMHAATGFDDARYTREMWRLTLLDRVADAKAA